MSQMEASRKAPGSPHEAPRKPLLCDFIDGPQCRCTVLSRFSWDRDTKVHYQISNTLLLSKNLIVLNTIKIRYSGFIKKGKLERNSPHRTYLLLKIESVL